MAPSSHPRKVLLTTDSSLPCQPPLAVILHDARNKLTVIGVGLDERTKVAAGYEKQRYESMSKAIEIVRDETKRLLDLARNGITDPIQFEEDMWHLCYRFRPTLSLVHEPQKEKFMVSREILEQSVGEFDGLIERGLLLIQARQPEDKPIYGNISEFVSTVVQNYQRLYPQICFTFNIDSDCNTSFYPTSIKRALENLLNNAIQALPEANGRIVVGLEERFYNAAEKPFEEIQDGIYVSIEIRDNGSGISEDILEQIQHSPITTKEDGSGIGLVSARKSMIQHHGHLFVESEEEHGTKVTALLPSTFPPPARLPKIG